jgi:hypothetical protein
MHPPEFAHVTPYGAFYRRGADSVSPGRALSKVV